MSSPVTRVKHSRTRSRSKSITEALQAIPLNGQGGEAFGNETPIAPGTPVDPIAHTASAAAALLAKDTTPAIKLNGSEDLFLKDQDEQAALRRRAAPGVKRDATARRKKDKSRGGGTDADMLKSRGFWNDWKSGRWMIIPSSQLPVLLIPIFLYINHRLLTSPNVFPSLAHALNLGRDSIIPENTPNPFEAFLFISHPSPPGAEAMALARNAALGHIGSNGAGVPGQTYMRGWKDIAFILYHIVFFSFLRQTVTLYLLSPIADKLGIPRGKRTRFLEQGYAFLYWGSAGFLGLFVMKGLPIWYYRTDQFWRDFPIFHMSGLLKTYYLWQFSYWLQQTLLLAARVEKPRKDFNELIAHHIVTLWLIGWSYYLTLTYIGVAVFVTMDLSDHYLALAKLVNYVDEKWSAAPFAFFVGVWTYARHYLNILILYSVWTEFDLIPAYERQGLDFWNNKLATPWLKKHIFAPILMLQFLNLFWYFLIWRILLRAIFSKNLADERSDDEDSGDEDAAVVKPKKE